MSIVTVVSEDEVRRQLLQIIFKNVFHFTAHVWHEPILKSLQKRVLQPGARKQLGCTRGFSLSDSDRAEHSPMKFAIGVLIDQAQNRTPTADLDII
jgi:hypothetical protein